MSKPFKSYKVKSKHGDTQKLSLQIKMIDEEDVNKKHLNIRLKALRYYRLNITFLMYLIKNA